MGENAEMVLEGILCQFCGDLIDGESTGYPRSCGCDSNDDEQDASRHVSAEKIEHVTKILIEGGYGISYSREINYGFQFRTTSGSTVNIYTTGKYLVQGKPDEKLKELIRDKFYKK